MLIHVYNASMKYGFVLPRGDARTAADFARSAEEAGWDGFFVWEPVWGVDAWVSLTFEQVAAIRDYTNQRRRADRPYDIILEGVTTGGDRAGNASLMKRWQEAGATWWIEAQWEAQTQEEVLRRIQQGPPGG